MKHDHAHIAVSMPGRMGDALYALPTARYLFESTGQQVDFYTSDYCTPIKTLLEYQECINQCIIPPDYVIERHDMGVQPWEMPIPANKYDRIYQLGFRTIPDEPLHTFMAKQVGITAPLSIRYDFRDLGRPMARPYVCIAPRGTTSYTHFINQLIDALLSNDIGIVIIGGEGDNVHPYKQYVLDVTGADMLTTLAVLAHAQGFVGLMSSQLVLANGFNIPKVGLNGLLSDMRHAIKSDLNYYPEDPHNPSLAHILGFLIKELDII